MKRRSVVLSLAMLACAAGPALAQAQEAAKPAEEKTVMQGLLAVGIGLLTAIVALLISLWLAMQAVKRAIEMFDKTTKDIDEWAELSKGNVAVGILMAAMVFSVANIISNGVQGLTSALMTPSLTIAFLLGIVVGVVNLLVALWIATTVISLAIKALDKATERIEEMKEIAKGNVAVAILVGGVLLAVSHIVGSAVEGFSKILDIRNLASVFGWQI